jgi:hypothetical protein
MIVLITRLQCYASGVLREATIKVIDSTKLIQEVEIAIVEIQMLFLNVDFAWTIREKQTK